jgi:type II secretory pathway component GspD/PulD (secretin)
MMKTLTLALAAALALPVAAQDRTRQEYEAKLANLKVTLDFKEAPIDSVIDYLREISDMNIFLDGKVREKNLTLSLKVSDISLRSVLALILKPQGCDVMFREGVLMVMTKEDVADRTVKMEIYDCRDILYPIQQFPGVDLDLDQAGKLIATPPPDDGDVQFPVEELIRAHTGGRSWEENPKCGVALNNGLLVVKNTPEVHKQVRRLLDLLRSRK